MKNVLFSRHFRVIVCIGVLCSMGLCLLGCSSPGETSSEVHRRRRNVLRTNRLQMQDDVDKVNMLDRPSRLSDMHTR